MKMPEFTAEASLPKTGEPYRILGTMNPSTRGGEVVPQHCELYCDADNCFWVCRGRPGPVVQ
jgi:hypothetical protein